MLAVSSACRRKGLRIVGTRSLSLGMLVPAKSERVGSQFLSLRQYYRDQHSPLLIRRAGKGEPQAFAHTPPERCVPPESRILSLGSIISKLRIPTKSAACTD